MKTTYTDLLHRKKMTLIMSLPANDPELARAAWENGAEVVKVHINLEHRAGKTLFKSFSEEKERLNKIIQDAKGPCGIVLGADPVAALKDFGDVCNAGFDFISLYAQHTPLTVMLNSNIIKMIALDSSFTLEEAANMEKIGVDVLEASIMKAETYGQPLTAKELLQYTAICSTTKLPVVIPTQRYIIPDELPLLSHCGAAGLMIGAIVTGKTADSIAKAVYAFRNAIDKMPG